MSLFQIVPCIHKIFSFEDLPEAYKCAAEGHLRGKIVIDMSLEKHSVDKATFLK